MPKYNVKFEGLNKKPTYDELIDSIQNPQDKIKYPDRTAKQMIESPLMAQIQREGFVDVEQQEEKLLKNSKKII